MHPYKRRRGPHGATRARIEDREVIGGRGGPRGGNREGKRGKRFAGEDLHLMVLGLLEAEEPQHGYQLIRGFGERSAEAYSPSPGVLYPLLTMLQDMELVAEVDDVGGKRRSYRLTGAGRAELESGRETLEALFARLAQMAETAQRTDGGPMRRAMMNLRVATRARLAREDASDDLVFQAAAILDEAAQKIERL